MKTIVYERNPQIEGRESWPAGEWDSEPDKIQWEDEATGYPCLALRNRMGAWCGYVGVPNGHRFYGTDYDNVYIGHADEYDEENYPPAHGGLTFAGKCREGEENQVICHVPDEGETDDVWWLGFDCNHAGDEAPGMRQFTPRLVEWETYKNLAYVRNNVADVAEWLKVNA